VRAGNLDTEVEVHEGLELDGEQLVIPTGIERQFVVGNHVGFALSRVEVRQAHRRNALHLKQLRGLNPPMSRDDLVVVAHQYRIREAEPADAVGNLSDLFFRVGARVRRIGPQRRQADGNDV
jgi:hypothetical protein